MKLDLLRYKLLSITNIYVLPNRTIVKFTGLIESLNELKLSAKFLRWTSSQIPLLQLFNSKYFPFLSNNNTKQVYKQQKTAGSILNTRPSTSARRYSKTKQCH